MFSTIHFDHPAHLWLVRRAIAPHVNGRDLVVASERLQLVPPAVPQLREACSISTIVTDTMSAVRARCLQNVSSKAFSIDSWREAGEEIVRL